MDAFVDLLLLSANVLPGAIWFARDAVVARLNPWVWAVWGCLSVAVPPLLLVGLSSVLTERGFLVPQVDQRWIGIIGLSIMAVGWFTAYVIHKRVLEPKRVAAIGTSLNYVGGWLGLLIYMLFLSVGLTLVTYVGKAYKTFEQLCPGLQTGEALFRCALASTPGAWETGFVIVSVVGLSWAGIALSRKARSAVRITGYMLIGIFLVACWEALDVLITEHARSSSTNEQRHDPAPTQDFVSGNVVWVGYLIRSRRVREVYGRNLGRSMKSSAGREDT